MFSDTDRHCSTSNPPQRRHHSRWRNQQELSRVAQSWRENTLGHIVDVGLGGFQLSLSQPVPLMKTTSLWLILDPFPEPPQTLAVKATPVWLDEDPSSGLRSAGFRFDDLKLSEAALIAQHLKAHKSDYSRVHLDTERGARQPSIPSGRQKQAAPSPRTPHQRAPVALVVFGFSERERQRLNNIITLSALRSPSPDSDAPTYLLHTVTAMIAADLVLVDADDPDAVDASIAYLIDKPPIPTIKMSRTRGADTDPHTIPRRFVPPQILAALDAACRESATDR